MLIKNEVLSRYLYPILERRLIMKRIYVLVSLIVLVASLVAACGPKPTVAPTVTPTPVPPTSVPPTPVPEVKETSEEEKYGGTLRLSTSRKIGVIDPTLTQSTYLIRFANNLYASLVRYISGTWVIVPGLAAEMPTISEDGLEYTFRLRSGIKFHDGTPITTEDVIFSLERAASDTSVWRARYESVEEEADK